MSCSCSYDYERPEFYKATERTAQKQHKCCECGHLIQPGETYESVAGKWGGEVNSVSTCVPCMELRDAINEHYNGCFSHYNLREEYMEYLHDNYKGIAFEKCHEVFAKHRDGVAV